MAWSCIDIENLISSESESNEVCGTGEKLSGDDNGSGIYKSNDGGATGLTYLLKYLERLIQLLLMFKLLIHRLQYINAATEYKYYSYLFKSTDEILSHGL